MNQKTKKVLALVVLTILMLSACSPEVGSDAWCKALKEKNKEEWTLGETKDFAKHCLLK